jgi:sugar/nucleoside kinase (ribokinase family)
MNKLLIVGTVAFDAIETPFGKTDKILGGAATYIGLSASHFNVKSGIVSVVGEDFPQEYLDLLSNKNIESAPAALPTFDQIGDAAVPVLI